MPDDVVSLNRDNNRRLAELEERLREAEMALRVCNSKLRIALDVGKLGSWERDLKTGEITGSPTFKANLGLPTDTALTYDDLQRAFHPSDVERINQAISYALKTRTDFSIEHRVLRPEGNIGRVLTRGSIVYENDKAVRLAGITQDATERERAKEEVSLAQHRQEFLLELNDQIGNLEDPYRIMEETARRLAEFLKVDSAGYGEFYEDRQIMIIEREWSRGIIGNEGRVLNFKAIPQQNLERITQGQPVIIDDVETHPDYSDPETQEFYRTQNVRTGLGVPLLKNGHLKAAVYISSSSPRIWQSDDISLVADVAERTWLAIEKARAEANLRETESKFRIIAEALPALVWILDTELRLRYTNDRWIEFSGLPPNEALGYSWKDWIEPGDLERVIGEMAIAAQAKSPHTSEIRYRTKEGVYRWHLIQAGPLLDANGELTGWAGTSVDIHDLKEAEEALRRSEEQLRLAVEVAQMGDWLWDVASDQMTLSDRAAEIFGLPVGRPTTWERLTKLMHSADAQRATAAMKKAAETRTNYDIEYRIKRADNGTRIWVAAQGRALFDKDGTFLGMTGVVQDITDRKHAEERQHLLIRELHHRVKNTLATVQAIVGSTARTANSIDEFYQGFVGRIVSLARTHNLLTEDLWQKASLEELIQTELGPYEDEARNRVVIEGPSVELPSEAAVPIGMAIHELTTNAAKHGALSTFGGQVEVKWRIEPGEERPILHFSWTENGGPRVTAPSRQGFGSRLLQRVLTTQLQAHVNMDFQEQGLRFTMVMPIPGEPPLFNPDQ